MQIQIFFKSTTAPDCSRDFRPDGEIHLSCRLEIANLVTGEYFCRETVKLEEKALKTVKSSIQDITEGEEDECEQLMYALILSGLAMQMIGNSRPASCAEHQVTHLWDMEVINGPLDALHGEKVSVAALLVLEEYKRIATAITQGRCHVKPYENEDEELLKETFGKKGLLEEIRKENEPELLETISPQHLEKCLNGIEEIIDELPSEQTMFRLLEKAGCAKPFMISDLMNRLFCQASGLLLIQEDG